MVIYMFGSHRFMRESSFGMSLSEIRTVLTGSVYDVSSSSIVSLSSWGTVLTLIDDGLFVFWFITICMLGPCWSFAEPRRVLGSVEGLSSELP